MTVVAVIRNTSVDADLAAREAVIERGLWDAALEWAVIREQRLYRGHYESFEDYCQQRWGVSRRHVDNAIAAAGIVQELRTNGSQTIPANERQARELAGLDPEVAAEVMAKVAKDHDAEGRKITAKSIREARKQVDTTGRDILALEFITKYPSLAYYADKPAKVIATGRQLDTFSATELPSRLDTLAKHIAAERRSEAEPPKPETPDYYAMTSAMFDAANSLAQIIDREGGADTLTAALADADAFTVQLWADQFASAISKLDTLAKACRAGPRSVK